MAGPVHVSVPGWVEMGWEEGAWSDVGFFFAWWKRGGGWGSYLVALLIREELESRQGSWDGQDRDPVAPAGRGGAAPHWLGAIRWWEMLTPVPWQAKHPGGPAARAGQVAGGLQHPVLADHVSAARLCPPHSSASPPSTPPKFGCVGSGHDPTVSQERGRGMPQRCSLPVLPSSPCLCRVCPPPSVILSPEPPPMPSPTSAGRWWASRPCGESRTWAAPSPLISR